jgi:hypothetical protein
MAGKIVASTINDDTGVLATQNGMTGIAKAWVNFDGTGTVAIRDSFNVSSITDNGTGDYTVNFTTVMPNANYSSAAMPLSANAGATVVTSTKATSTFRILASIAGTGVTDFSDVSVTVFSS